MAKSQPKLVLAPAQGIPFNRLVLSQSNVRRVKDGISIEQLAGDIERRGLLQSLSVRPELDGEGNATGRHEVPAGGRRYRALEMLVKRKRLAGDAIIPCVVKPADSPVSAEEDSYAENAFREALHPLDEFRGMQRLVDNGDGVETIAAVFHVTPAVVRQRLKLASVSPKLLELYGADGMTLEQLMAFSVSDDHDRQEQVWALMQSHPNLSPWLIRKSMTETSIAASDPRARFIGLDAYAAAGGCMLRDLFEDDRGGWLQDAALLDRLVLEKLGAEAERIRGEGWKWVETALVLPYGFHLGMRQIEPLYTSPSEDDLAQVALLKAEAEALEEEWCNADAVPEAVDARVTELDEKIAALAGGTWEYDPADMAIAGVFVTIDRQGALEIEPGWVRAEDEPGAAGSAAGPVHGENDGDRESAGAEEGIGGSTGAAHGDGEGSDGGGADGHGQGDHGPGGGDAETLSDDEDEGLKPLPDRLISELTAERTIALQDAIAGNPDLAFAAVLHNFVLACFYHGREESCLTISLSRVSFGLQPPGMKTAPAAEAIEARHAAWKERLPQDARNLWDALGQLDASDQGALFAHCAAYSVNALYEAAPKYDHGRTSAHIVERRLTNSHILARAAGLHMVAAGWIPTADNYLGRVTKARILEAVTEARGSDSAALIDHLKKPDMAREAERLMAGSGWLPEPLRTPALPTQCELAVAEPADLPALLADPAGAGDAPDNGQGPAEADPAPMERDREATGEDRQTEADRQMTDDPHGDEYRAPDEWREPTEDPDPEGSDSEPLVIAAE